MNTLKWLLKREFWEHKGAFFYAPLILAIVMVGVTALTLGFGMSSSNAPFRHLLTAMTAGQAAMPGGFAGVADLLATLSLVAASPLLLMLTASTFFYCLAALYDERRDRSILFWKSLPLSDTHTVLSKVITVTIVAPLIVIGVSTATSVLLVLCASTIAALNGVNLFGALLTSRVFLLAPLRSLGMLPVYMIWALPTVGWLLMVSAWARSKVFLWAVGVPVIALVLVKWITYVLGAGPAPGALMQTVVGRILLGLVPGSWLSGETSGMDSHNMQFTIDRVNGLLADSWAILASPGAWVGAVAGMAMIYAAIRLRRFRDEG
ncbi:hypothetical protein [Massilia antarctica]|uniref:hypothetical protein n=1 Tax=Massilia antarctica TaxID=2765360 RepID=UPI0006BB618C|nr:hypothetical protein [Massilia sp. H27-R4]MCY0910692.1 hypothetical protein [Massilia sp. H27-R4]CUI08935.1 ABC transporter, permease protein, putative [Janthinobacterium sp. CG23_2]CUU32721.1 ABC transporter, permease protein, putative [Janthinobacterium sp. CG23_2]